MKNLSSAVAALSESIHNDSKANIADRLLTKPPSASHVPEIFQEHGKTFLSNLQTEKSEFIIKKVIFLLNKAALNFNDLILLLVNISITIPEHHKSKYELPSGDNYEKSDHLS